MILQQKICLIAGVAALLVNSRAENSPAPADPKTDTGATETPAPYELKNRSKFGIALDARAPFWPIGWVKPKFTNAETRVERAVVTEETGKKFLVQPQHFNVTTVLSGNPPLATINGRAFGEGEVLPVMVGNERVRVVVQNIRDGGVTLQQDSHVIFVPLRRASYIPRPVDDAPKADEFVIRLQ